MPTVIRRARTACITACASILLACSISRVPTARVTPRNRAEISSAEMEPVSRRVTDAYDMVDALRPWMLMVRDRTGLDGTNSSLPNDVHGVRVYVDGISMGGIEMLRALPRDAVVHVQWLSPIDATTRYGTGHMGGVIAVSTSARRR